MAFRKVLIASYETGLENDIKPYALPDDAFAELNNAYVWRNRVRKRFGSYLLNETVERDLQPLYSRLRIKIGVTDNAGVLVGGPVSLPGVIFKDGQMISCGNDMFTITNNVAGTYISGNLSATLTWTYTASPIGVTVALDDPDQPLTDVYFYPAEPVMGFGQYQTDSINDIPTYAFDTQFSYQRSGGGWDILGTTADIWTGTNANFFWTTNWRGSTNASDLFWATNNVADDGLSFWNGTNWNGGGGLFQPAINAAGDAILTALILIPFKDRLIALNTTEGASPTFVPVTYQNRARYSQNGDPTDATHGWREDEVGRGGYIDAPTKEPIVSAQIYKDRLIVFFSNSTWELVYTQNQILPFIWQQINVELGAESTFATIPFNDGLLSVGNVGIHVCNGGSVERIDTKIPNEVFDIHNQTDGIIRVHGIRDYFLEMAYWTLPSKKEDVTEYTSTYPNRVLVYNYKNKSWAFNDDSITCFGYWQQQTDSTWASMDINWEDAEETWDSPILGSVFRSIIAGNQQGYTFILSPDIAGNAPSLSVTDISNTTQYLTVIDHNLKVGDFVFFDGAQGTDDVDVLNFANYQVSFIKDENTIQLKDFSISGSYYGGATLCLVSRIDFYTKEFNFFKDGRNMYVEKIDCYIDRTATGAMSYEAYTDSSYVQQLADGAATNTTLGTNVLETTAYATVPYERTQERVWHSIYLNSEGNTVQVEFYMSDEQMLNSVQFPAFQDFQLHAMMFYVMPTTQRLT